MAEQPRVPQAHDGAKLATYDPKSPAAFSGREGGARSSGIFLGLLLPSSTFLDLLEVSGL